MSQHVEGIWCYTEFLRPDGKPMESVEDVMVAVANSAEVGGAFLFGVTVEGLIDDNGLHKVVCYTGNGPLSAANARRIVACVNACQGIPTDALEDGAIEGLRFGAGDLIAFLALEPEASDPGEELYVQLAVVRGLLRDLKEKPDAARQ